MDSQDQALRTAVEKACLPTYVPYILAGREAVLALPRSWVISNVERIACQVLNLDDYWIYRRLLELYETLDEGLVARLVEIGLESKNPEIIEAAQDFKS